MASSAAVTSSRARARSESGPAGGDIAAGGAAGGSGMVGATLRGGSRGSDWRSRSGSGGDTSSGSGGDTSTGSGGDTSSGSGGETSTGSGGETSSGSGGETSSAAGSAAAGGGPASRRVSVSLNASVPNGFSRYSSARVGSLAWSANWSFVAVPEISSSGVRLRPASFFSFRQAL